MSTIIVGHSVITLSPTLLDASPALCALVDGEEYVDAGDYAAAARAYEAACAALDDVHTYLVPEEAEDLSMDTYSMGEAY